VASTSGVVGCSHDPSFVANDDSPYCEEIVSRWPYYQSKILAEKQALVRSLDSVPLDRLDEFVEIESTFALVGDR